MKKYIVISILLTASAVILIKSGVANSLLLFVLVGAVPGTNITLSPALMLLVIVAVVILSGSKLLSKSDTQTD